jgi:transposase-like protein
MAKIDNVLCPVCLFTSNYINLIITDEEFYMCPKCKATFSYEELMQLYTISQFSYDISKTNQKPNP